MLKLELLLFSLNLKGHKDIFNTFWVTGLQTLEKKLEKCSFPIFEWSPLAHNATKIAKFNRFTNRPTNLCVKITLMLQSFLSQFLPPCNLALKLRWKIAILTSLYKIVDYSVNIHPRHLIFWLSSLYMFIFLQINISKIKIWAGDLWLSWHGMTQ